MPAAGRAYMSKTSVTQRSPRNCEQMANALNINSAKTEPLIDLEVDQVGGRRSGQKSNTALGK
jgi:hypothetical protein